MFAIGDKVQVKDAYLDEEMTVPVVGTVEDVFRRDDFGCDAFVVMFDHSDRSLPPGGEFSVDRLEALR